MLPAAAGTCILQGRVSALLRVCREWPWRSGDDLKKLQDFQRDWNARHSSFSLKRKLLHRTNRRIRNILGSEFWHDHEGRWVTVYSNGVSSRARLIGKPQDAPEILSLSKNYTETARFLNSLRDGLFQSARISATRRGRRVKKRLGDQPPATVRGYWNFATIREISPAVALIIASEYHRFSRGRNWVPRAVNIEAWDPVVRAVLDAVGFLSLAGTEPVSSEILNLGDLSILKMRAGHQASGEEVSKLLEELGVAEMLNDAPLYEAIIEALTNTRHHAYPETHQFEEPHVPGWWMTGFVNRQRREFNVIVFDQGVSIPVTLPLWKRFGELTAFWKRAFRSEPDFEDTANDGTAIRAAMTVGKSRTKEATRGKGLHAIEDAVNRCDNGELAIYSRYGEYRKSSGRSSRHFNRNDPVGGTLVVWRMCFSTDRLDDDQNR